LVLVFIADIPVRCAVIVFTSVWDLAVCLRNNHRPRWDNFYRRCVINNSNL